jgi:hypothetical protein
VGGFDDLIVRALATFGTDVYVGGHFTAAGTAQANFVARFDTLTDQWSALGGGVKWYNDNFTTVYSLAADESGIFVGGAFDQAGGRSASGFARWGGPLAGGNIPAHQGGQVAGPEGLIVDIPAGAATDDRSVRLAGLAGPRQPLPQGQAGVRSFGAAATTLTGQAVTSFLKPYTLKASYIAEQLAAAGISDPSTLNLLAWDGAAWQPLLPCAGCSVDTTNRVVTVVASRLSEFALSGAVSNSGPEHGFLFLPLVQAAE